MKTILLALAMLLDASRMPVSRELEFDLIEINHRNDENGRHCYDQLILWDWSPDYRRYHVAAWFLLDERQGISLNRSGGYWVMKLHKPEEPVIKVRAKIKRETWTKFDPERVNKELFPEKHRRGLK